MKITDALIAEHVVFHNIFDHIERIGPKLKTVAEVQQFAQLLEALLKLHSEAEEDLVFSPLEHYLEQIGMKDTFEDEHKEIHESLFQVKAAKTTAEARKLLAVAVLASRRHFDHEERIVFPLAEKHLKKETLLSMGKAWQDRHKAYYE